MPPDSAAATIVDSIRENLGLSPAGRADKSALSTRSLAALAPRKALRPPVAKLTAFAL